MKKNAFLFLIILQAFLLSAQEPTVYIASGVNTYSVIEGDTYTFTVSMYSATTTDVIVDVETIANTADATDYTPLTTTVTIPAGQLSSNQLTIPTNNDSDIEENESFIIEASVTSNNIENTIVSKSITLWDNDTMPTINTLSIANIVEGQSETNSLYLSNYYSSDVIIDFSTLPGTADNSDYIPTSSSITIPAGERHASYSLITLQDNLAETDETYTVNATVTSGNTINNTIDVEVTILDDDTIPTFSTIAQNRVEGYTSNIYVSLDRVFNSDVVIQVETSDGTADNSDYSGILQTKTIEAGDDEVVFQIPILDDDIDEPQETISYLVTVVSGNTTNTLESGLINIIDNDGLPDFYLEPIYNPNFPEYASNLVAEEGYELKFRVRLTHPSPVDTEIEITTTNGTADDSDYTASVITTTISAGNILNDLEYFSYPTILDQLDEENETVYVDAVVSSGNTYNTDFNLEGLILDNYHLNAQQDDISTVLQVGATYQILENDTFEGLPVASESLNVSLVNTNSVGISLSSTGILSVPSDVPEGYYTIEYQICDNTDASNCDTANVFIIVESPLDVISTATYVDFNGDGFTSAGDVVEYEFIVTNNGNTPIIDIDTEVYFQNLDIIGGPLASLGAGETDVTTFTATKIIDQDHINYGYNFYLGQNVSFVGNYYDYELQEYLFDSNSIELQQSDGIRLNAFVDTNGNGTQETDEINFPLGHFNYEINNDGVINNLYVSPHYLYESNPTTTYELSYTVDADFAANNTATSYSNITVPVGSGITTYDFPITVTAYDDLAADVSAPRRPPMPGFEYWNYISYTNNSNETVTSGMIEFTLDEALSLLNVYEAPPYWNGSNVASFSTTPTGFTYVFSDLEPYETKNLWVKMQVPTLPTVSLGQIVTNTVDIELLAGDILPLNNTSSLMQTIVGSYDPNDITEKHGEEILYSSFTTEDYLIYTIRFENTGTANAINVRVEDMLDDQLDESTLKIIDASHSYSLERVGKHLEWRFSGIDLPPSENDENSQVGHGFITFKIKPFPDFEIGDVIPNTAEIYFDFNPAIITNTWVTTFVENLNINESELYNLKVYPNPTKQNLKISNNSIITSIEINSIEGKKVFSKSGFDNVYNVDVSELTNGVYFMRIKGESEEKTIKFIKE